MRAFRSAGGIFKRLTARAAEEPKMKVEYDISPSHPKHVIRFCIHPEDEERAKKLMAANPSGIMERLAATADLFWKSGRALFKAKEGGLKEVLKNEGCCFSPESQRYLADLVQQSDENTARLEYLEGVADHYAKHGVAKGSPPPPLRPPAPSKQEANGNSNNNNNRKGKGDGDGDGSGKGDGKGNGNGNGYGNGGPPALSENGTLPEPFECPFKRIIWWKSRRM